MAYVKPPRSSGTNFRRLFPFLAAVNASEETHRVFVSDGFMPLSVEFLSEYWQSLPVYSMMHYYTQYGDLMRDPEMTFAVDFDNGKIIPLTFRQDGAAWVPGGTMYQEVFTPDGKSYRPRLLTDLDKFLAQWTTNIINQRFSLEKLRADKAMRD